MCALLASGNVFCWGANSHGELGDGTFNASSIPVKVLGLPLGATAIAVGWGGFSCAVLTDGTAWCWGGGSAGQLGDGILHPQVGGVASPVKVMGISGTVRTIDAGDVHACALTPSGAVFCWGANPQGQAGVGATPPAPEDKFVVTARATAITSGAVAISLGGYHSCALTNSNDIKCWGSNLSGQLGDGTLESKSMPVKVGGLPLSPVEIDGGRYGHTCALLSDKSIWCWGAIAGALSGADPPPPVAVGVPTPVRVNRLSAGVPSSISLGAYHTCTLLNNGSVWCWGSSDRGQLGNGAFTSSADPVQAIGW